MIFFKYLKSYFNYSFNGRASINEYIRLSVIDLVLFVFLLFAAISERLGQWPTAIIFGSLVWHHHAVTRRRQHDFYNQRPISNFDNPRSNPIEIFIVSSFPFHYFFCFLVISMYIIDNKQYRSVSFLYEGAAENDCPP